MKVYDQATKAVPDYEKMNMYEIYIARATEIFGVPKTREIYEVSYFLCFSFSFSFYLFIFLKCSRLQVVLLPIM